MSQEHEMEERLQEIERQLKQIRPIAPRLDVAAIVRLAEAAPPEVNLAARTRLRQDGRGQHSYRAIGLSWICGALAGAALMFVFIGRPQATSPEIAPSQLAKEPDRAADPPPSLPEVKSVVRLAGESRQRIRAASLVAAALCDPRGEFPSSGLSAGTHLSGIGGAASRAPEQITATLTGDSDRSASNDDFEPAPEITRGELMRRLMQGDQT